MKTADAQNQNLLPGKDSMSPSRQTKTAAYKAATLPVTTVTEVHPADRQLPDPAITKKYEGDKNMKVTRNDDTAANSAAPAEEAGTSLVEYIDGLIAALGKDYDNLYSGVKNLFIYSREGNQIALLHLCECYAGGVDLVPSDYKVAKRLLNEAALHGNEVARRLQHKDAGTWCLPIIINYKDGWEKAAWPAPSQTKEVKERQQDSEQTAPRDLAFRVA